MEISHEEFIKILNEKDKYERMKDNLKSESEKYMSKDTSCKAMYKIKDLKLLNAFFKNSFWMYKMESYCLKCKKNTENIDPEVSSTSNGRITILSKCAICGGKQSRFIKYQEAKGLLSKLGIKTALSKIPILGGILF